MRANRLIILLLLVACKATTPSSSSSSYTEDLSIHRPVIMPTEEDDQQSDNSVEPQKEPYTPLSGHIKQELDSISKVAFEQNKEGRYVDGYVIQVYSGNSREAANQARSKMYEFFAELEPKVSYHQPNFRVKAGKFTNRLKANRVHQQVKEEFPRALLLPEKFLVKYE
ncbi:SPOR domain-containing protein [Ekhidna sp. To15]|uniref:SPOR domain-containing protein n=1 Tax=Ekhidna sp. To15 TaxID=3395267 RepID=UPI003F522DC2